MSRALTAGSEAGGRVACSFCGLEFDVRQALRACGGCPLGANCRMLRCPRCGYENPREPRWLGTLRRLSGRHHED